MLSSNHNQPPNTRSFIDLLIKTPLVKRLQFIRLHHVMLKATFGTGCQITDNSHHPLHAFLFICSFWLWFCSQDFPLWLWCRTLSRDLLASHWFEEAGRLSSYLVTGSDPPQNGKGRSLASAAERRRWCAGNERSWRPAHLAPAWAEWGCPRGPCHRCC